MAYGSNSLGQENALSYPFPKWHPYYGWGFGPTAQGYQPQISGYPGQTPPGNWFGRPVVGARAWLRTANVAGRPLAIVAGPGDRAGPADITAPERTVALTGVGAAVFGVIGVGIGYLVTRSPLGALIGGAVGIATPYVIEEVGG